MRGRTTAGGTEAGTEAVTYTILAFEAFAVFRDIRLKTNEKRDAGPVHSYYIK